MFLRPVITIVIWVYADEDDLSYLYGLQMIIYKFAIFILLCVLFKMKQIQILINLDGEHSEQLYARYYRFVRNARIFLIAFIIDILIQAGLCVWMAF